jgi:hypothetical protein
LTLVPVRRRRRRRAPVSAVARRTAGAAAAGVLGGARRLPFGRRPPGAIEPLAARRRRARAERRTVVLGLAAVATTGVVLGGEVARVWRRGTATSLPAASPVIERTESAVLETIEVARAGYRESTLRETALLNMLTAFTLTFGVVRASTHTIRARGNFGPFRNLSVAGEHIHHFIPGIALAFGSGGTAVLARDQSLDPWLAIPFGMGVALTLDESALLLKLDDVYWSEEGIVSVQITLAALSTLSAAALALKILRRGEEQVLDGGEGPRPA